MVPFAVSTIIYSSENFSENSIYVQNRNYTYFLDSNNYNIFFAIYADLPDSTSLNFKELEKYIEIQYQYSASGHMDNLELMEFENCNIRKERRFLNLPFEDILENKTSPWSMCLSNPMKMGLFINPQYLEVASSLLMLKIQICHNSSLNNNSCASPEEIKEILKYTKIQATIPRTNYDFKNQSNPIKRSYEYENYIPDLKIKKSINNLINPSFLYSDWGLINDDYQLNSINFNCGQRTIDVNTNDENDNIIFEYKISISFQIDKFYIRNQKINDIIASFGGLINLVYALGVFFCFRLNRLLLLNDLINFTFKTSTAKERTKNLLSK